MNRKLIAILVVVIIIVLLVAAGLMTQLSNNNKVNNSKMNNPTTQITANNTIITPQEAQNQAQKYITEPGAVAGTPKLFNESGGLIYVVPVVMNNSNVGEIEIDAQTGENLGGSGG